MIKCIIAGVFDQLLSVKDCVKHRTYKNSIALHELCGGNKLTRTSCRGADAPLFNMLLQQNIDKKTKSTFGKL